MARPHRHPRRHPGFPLFILIASLPVTVLWNHAAAVTRHVPAGYATIAGALAAAVSGDTVLVACGTYAEHDLVMKSGITVRGAGGDPACVTIDASGLGRVFSGDLLNASTRLEGLTLTGGAAAGPWPASAGGGAYFKDSSPTIRDCVVAGNHAESSGGGIYVYEGTPVFVDCEFRDNFAEIYGGGLDLTFAPATVTHCTFTGNGCGVWGGGMRCNTNADAVITECTFRQNTSPLRAGALEMNDASPVIVGCLFEENVGNWGGATFHHHCHGSPTAHECDVRPVVRDCIYRRNHSTANAGAAYVEHAAVEFDNCLFIENTAVSFAGAMEFLEADGLITNCAFVRNSAPQGGAIRAWKVPGPIYRNCTFFGNSASGQGSTLHSRDSAPALENCILAMSPQGTPVSCAGTGTVTLSCSNVFGNAAGNFVSCIAGMAGVNGNFSINPLFCGPAIDDFHLDAASTCLDAPGCGRVGMYGQGCAGTWTDVPAGRAERISWGRAKSGFVK